MKSLILSMALMALLGSCASVTDTQTPSTLTLHGYANLLDTGIYYRRLQDNRDIQVTVEGTDLIAYTDSKGYYRIENIPSRDIIVHYVKDGYAPQRSTINNITCRNSISDKEPLNHYVTMTVDLFPFSDYTATISSASYEDRMTIRTYREGVIINSIGDTIDYGTIRFDTIRSANSMFTIRGNVSNGKYEPIHQSVVTLFFGTSPTVSCDTATWQMQISFIASSSEFTYQLYEQNLDLMKRLYFPAGSTIYLSAYARPQYHMKSDDGFGTELLGAYDMSKGDEGQKRIFTTIRPTPSVVRSFELR